jgi:hypothetical protein
VIKITSTSPGEARLTHNCDFRGEVDQLKPHSPKARFVRIVVQHVNEGPRWCYRLIAYEERKTYAAVTFDSARDLVAAIRSVVPEFSESKLRKEENAQRSYIALTGEWELNDSELAQLGVGS